MRRALVDEAELEAMAVVANNAMNRERGLRGRNSYRQELGLDPIDVLVARVAARDTSQAWLDLCSGSGRALRDAVTSVPTGRIWVEGVDLLPTDPSNHPNLAFTEASLRSWAPTRRYDLITCVHGLHYLGDTLGLLARIATWLTDDGRFVASFDADSIRAADGSSARAPVLKSLRANGFTYDARGHLLARSGFADIDLPFRFIGADPNAGPNYTGQPAVHGHYLPA